MRCAAIFIAFLCLAGCGDGKVSEPNNRNGDNDTAEKVSEPESRNRDSDALETEPIFYSEGKVTFYPGVSVPFEGSNVFADPNLRLTDAEVDALREKVDHIRYPVAPGTTTRILQMPEELCTRFWGPAWYTIVPLGDDWDCSSDEVRGWILNERRRLIVCRATYMNARGETKTIETRGGIHVPEPDGPSPSWDETFVARQVGHGRARIFLAAQEHGRASEAGVGGQE